MTLIQSWLKTVNLPHLDIHPTYNAFDRAPLVVRWADFENRSCGNKVCSARPISSQPVGRPSVQWGLPDEQHWTTVRSMTPFPSSDPRPQPLRHFSGGAQQRFSALYKSTHTDVQGRRSWTQIQRRRFNSSIRLSERWRPRWPLLEWDLYCRYKNGNLCKTIYTHTHTHKKGLMPDNLTGLQTSRLK